MLTSVLIGHIYKLAVVNFVRASSCKKPILVNITKMKPLPVDNSIR
jgi:hypothetical protein